MAAGSSSRLGRPKQLLPWGRRSLVRHVLDQIIGIDIQPILVVTGASADAVKAELPAEVTAIENSRWQEGLGSSIAAGLAAMVELEPDVSGVVIVLADQPMITHSHLRLLISSLSVEKSFPRPIVATSYNSGPGVPALFPSETFDLLYGLKGEGGAKDILRNRSSHVHCVKPDFDPTDIDTQEDFRQLTKQLSRTPS